MFPTRYSARVPTEGTVNDEPSLTLQSEYEGTTIDYYLKRYSATGLLGDPQRQAAARFDDVSEVSDFQTALNKVLEVQRAFGELSADERRKFGDDPQAWVAHLVEEQQKAGKPVEPVEPVDPQPVSKAESVQKPTSQGD